VGDGCGGGGVDVGKHHMLTDPSLKSCFPWITLHPVKVRADFEVWNMTQKLSFPHLKHFILK
jgi:hypothetical protein